MFFNSIFMGIKVWSNSKPIHKDIQHANSILNSKTEMFQIKPTLADVVKFSAKLNSSKANIGMGSG